MIWAGKKLNIYNNEILDNPFPVMLVSFLATYQLTKDKEYVPIAASEQARMEVSIEEETSLREDRINAEFKTDKDYNPYNIDISLRNNTYSFGSIRKKMQSNDGLLVTLGLWGKDAHIWYDGVPNPNGKTFCTKEKDQIMVAHLDMMNNYENVEIKAADEDCVVAELTNK